MRFAKLDKPPPLKSGWKKISPQGGMGFKVISHFWVPKTLTFKVYETILVKMSFSCIRKKIILDQLAICTSPVIHSVCTPPPPPPTFCTIIVFSFSWDDCNLLRRNERQRLSNFVFLWGGGGGGTRCIIGDIHTYIHVLFIWSLIQKRVYQSVYGRCTSE